MLDKGTMDKTRWEGVPESCLRDESIAWANVNNVKFINVYYEILNLTLTLILNFQEEKKEKVLLIITPVFKRIF